ncbi:MAG: hypothetical protein WC869_01645 [Phycisphaerae bacterium]|jgi:sugar lactone lactonase YvrE
MAVIRNDDLLKSPPALADLPVARTAPEVNVHLLSDLPTDNDERWLNMADGCLASNGRFYTGVGNTLEDIDGRGQSRIYELDPASGNVRLFADVRATLSDPLICAGKLQARLDQGRDGKIYLATHCGLPPSEAAQAAGYKGSAIIAFDPNGGQVELIDVPAHGDGMPASRLDAQRMLLYTFATPSNHLLIYDLMERKVVFRGLGESVSGTRHIMLDRDGNAYFTVNRGFLARYSPETNLVEMTAAQLPMSRRHSEISRTGNKLRASTEPTSDGTIYGMTHHGVLFAFEPHARTLRELGPNLDDGVYTVTLALSRNEKYLYYSLTAPEGASLYGVPIIQYELATGRRKAIAFLGDAIRQAFDYRISRNFNTRLSPDGTTLYFTFNGARPVAEGQVQDDYGLPSIVTVRIPDSEQP